MKRVQDLLQIQARRKILFVIESEGGNEQENASNRNVTPGNNKNNHKAS